MIGRREKEIVRHEVDDDQHLRMCGGLREEIGMEIHMHGPLDVVKKLKLRFRVANLDLPDRRKRYIISQEEE